MSSVISGSGSAISASVLGRLLLRWILAHATSSVCSSTTWWPGPSRSAFQSLNVGASSWATPSGVTLR